ncbi:hypothetical protein ACFE04_007757 [Oxalis oulophora]
MAWPRRSGLPIISYHIGLPLGLGVGKTPSMDETLGRGKLESLSMCPGPSGSRDVITYNNNFNAAFYPRSTPGKFGSEMRPDSGVVNAALVGVQDPVRCLSCRQRYLPSVMFILQEYPRCSSIFSTCLLEK